MRGLRAGTAVVDAVAEGWRLGWDSFEDVGGTRVDDAMVIDLTLDFETEFRDY